jgi:Holliday junction resolvasome RuvABC endonuclease subunit
MVVRTLGLTETPPHDAADALAAALTHFYWYYPEKEIK